MNFKNRTLSTEIKDNPENMEYQKKKKRNLKHLKFIFKINSIDFSFLLFLYVGLLGFEVVANLFRVLL